MTDTLKAPPLVGAPLRRSFLQSLEDTRQTIADHEAKRKALQDEAKDLLSGGMARVRADALALRDQARNETTRIAAYREAARGLEKALGLKPGEATEMEPDTTGEEASTP